MLTIMLSISSVSAADISNSTTKQKKSLRAEVTTHLSQMGIDVVDIAAHVTFKLNRKNRIEVIEVDCADHEVCKTIKKQLEGRKISTKLSDDQAEYEISVEFKQE